MKRDSTPVDTDALIKKGYRRVSNKFGHVARIDRPDWREHMAERNAPWDPKGQGMEWVRLLEKTPGSAEDHYRRCYSKDVLVLSPGQAKRVPPSAHDPAGYIEGDR